MGIITTPIFGLTAPDDNDPLANVGARMRATVTAIETALSGRSVSPPGASDLAAIYAAKGDKLTVTYGTNEANNTRAAGTTVSIPSWGTRTPTTPPAIFTVMGDGGIRINGTCLMSVYLSVGFDMSAQGGAEALLRHRSGGVDEDIPMPLVTHPAGLLRLTGGITRSCINGDLFYARASGGAVAFGLRASSSIRFQRLM